MGAEGSITGAAVRVRHRADRLELSFDRGFSPADLAAVRAIAGRRWQPERRVWTLPRSPRTLATLERAFGPRLVVVGAGGAEPDDSANSKQRLARHAPARPGPAVLLAELRKAIRSRGYSPKTEAAYVGWVRRFLRHSATGAHQLDASDVRAFLEHLAVEQRLAPSSRNQAASALGFLFREVLGRDELADVPRAKGPKRVPVVLTHGEVLRVLRELEGKYFLIVALLYSAGLRLQECLALRVKDIDFELRQILVRDGKGRKDRYVPLARRVSDLLRARIRRIADLHDDDRARDAGWAPLPDALHRKDPSAGYELRWQYLFPASTLNDDPATGRTGRHPLHPTAVQREVKAAVRRAGIPKRATCHTFRHSFATEALRGGCDIRTLQHVMGHKDLRTTTIYLHVIEQTGLHIRSPLDRPDDDLEPYDPDPVERPWTDTRLSEGREGKRRTTDPPRD